MVVLRSPMGAGTLGGPPPRRAQPTLATSTHFKGLEPPAWPVQRPQWEGHLSTWQVGDLGPRCG